jgi:hypothetical protein
MGGSILGYKQGSLMSDLSKHIEMHAIKSTADQAGSIEEKKKLENQVRMMQNDVAAKRQNLEQV